MAVPFSFRVRITENRRSAPHTGQHCVGQAPLQLDDGVHQRLGDVLSPVDAEAPLLLCHVKASLCFRVLHRGAKKPPLMEKSIKDGKNSYTAVPPWFTAGAMRLAGYQHIPGAVTPACSVAG